MSDFWEDGGKLELWIDYYGSYGHSDPRCDKLGKTRRKAATNRPECPECGSS